MALTRITKGVIKPNENYDTHNINSTGIVTAIGLDINGNGDISGNLSVGGVLTYEDVTSIDSVGIITAQKDIHVGAGLSVVGVTTLTGRILAGGTSIPGYSGADDLTIGSETGHHGITIRSGATNNGGLFFSDDTVGGSNSNQWAAGIEYNHPSSDLRFYVGNTWRFSFQGVGHYIPYSDSTINIGNSSKRFLNVFANYLNLSSHATISGDLDVDGHTNLDNVSIAGVTTMSGNVRIQNDSPILYLTDTGNNPDYQIKNNNGYLDIFDETNTATRLSISNTGELTIPGNSNFNSGIDVTGNANVSGDLDVDGHTNLDNVSISGITTTNQITISSSGPRITFNDSNENPDFYIEVNASQFLIQDATANAQRFRIQSNGVVDINGNTNFSGGIDVTGGPITSTGDINANGNIVGDNSTNISGINQVTAATFVGDGQNITGNTIRSNLTFDGAELDVNNSGGSARLYLISGNSADSSIYFGRQNDGATGGIRYEHTDDSLKFMGYNNADKMVIDSSGNVLVGTTDTSVYNNGSGNGIVLRGGQVIDIARSNDLQLTLNRMGNDGPHIAFYKGGGQKSFISTRGNAFCIDVNGTNERLRIQSDGKLIISTNANTTTSFDYANIHFNSDNSTVAEGLFINNIAANTGDNASISFSTDSGNRHKSAISHVDTGAYGRGDLVFSIDPDADSGELDIVAHEKVRITSAGQFLMGTTSSTGARVIIQQNSSDTNPLDQQTCADSSGMRLHNYSFGTGRYTALSLECCNSSSVQSASIIAQSVASGVSPDIIFTQRTSNTANSERIRIKSDSSLLHTRTDNVQRYDVEFRNTGGISDGNYGGIKFTQGSTGQTGLAAIEIAYANTGRPDIVFRHRNRGGGTTFDEAMRIDSNGKIGINNNSPECRTGGIDMSSNDGTSGKTFTDMRGHSQLILRNPSTTQHSFTQLMFENGGGTSAATMLRHRLGPSSGSQQNFVGDLCLFRRTGNAGGSNNDYRESTRWCGATEQARQIWWASGDTDTGGTTRLGWHHLSASRDHPGTDAYTFFRLETGAASYSRNGMGKYTVVWTTGHASGYGLQIGHFGYYMHHGSSTIVVNEHIIHRERYSNGSYYGWNDGPNMRIINSSASGGTNACIVFRCGGRRHAGYDMSVVVGLFVDLYVPESANGDTNPRLYVAGNSESNLAGGGFGNPVSHAYVSFQSSNPNHSGQP